MQVDNSKEEVEKNYKKRNIMFLCIASIIIYTIFTFNLSNSRYMGKISAEDDVLAVPILTLSNNSQTYSITNMLPGDEQEYTFSVSNVDGEKTNEVLLAYCFKINMETEVPLEIKIYDITSGSEQEIQITDNASEQLQMNVVEQETDRITRNYKLKIIWSESNNSYEYAGKEINCKIILEAIQVTK